MYHIVAADSRAARTGKFLEVIGRYEPLQHPALIETTEDRLFHWLKRGALPTDTVRSLLRRSGAWIKWSMAKKGLDEGSIATEMEKWRMFQTAKLQREGERKVRRLAARKHAKKPEAQESAPVAETPAQ